LIYLPVTLGTKLYVSSLAEAGKSQALEMSAYIYQLPYVGAGLVVMLVLLWRYADWRHGSRMVPLVLALVILYSLYGASDRFKMIGALVGAAVVLGAAVRPTIRLAWFTPVVIASIILFSFGGASRDRLRLSAEELQTAAWERFRNAHDANFLDGFVFSVQGAERFGHHYGLAHLEILYRPIPRAIWPGKPIRNYQIRAMGLDAVMTYGTIGISPSLFGTFYEEAGGPGVILLSFLYGIGLAYLVRKISTVNPAFAAVLRGALCGWLVSLFRGGDIAGIVAWAFMSYWPIAVFFYVFRKEILSRKDWIQFRPRRHRRIHRRQPNESELLAANSGANEPALLQP
jgi:hypothetical protein